MRVLVIEDDHVLGEAEERGVTGGSDAPEWTITG
jgi:hypothetical protein